MGITKDELENLYYKEKKSTRKIAKIKNVGKTTVEYYFKKFGIKLRGREEAAKLCSKEHAWSSGLSKETDRRVERLARGIKKACTKKRNAKIRGIEAKFKKPLKEILSQLYVDKKFTQEQVAGELGLNRRLIISFMKEFGIPKRPKYQYVSSLKGAAHSQFGKSWESRFGHEKAAERKKEHSERFKAITVRMIANNEFPFFDTSIEKTMAESLLRKNIPFIKQFNIDGKFVCDFAIPSCKLIIECDGDYWHANPKIYKRTLTFSQQKNTKRDKAKNAYLKKRGWAVLRFFESEIKSNAPGCINKVEEELKKVQSPLDRLK